MAWTINDIDVASLSIDMPHEGNWHCRADVIGVLSKGTKASIVDDAGQRFKGIVTMGGEHAGRSTVEIIGGNGGLREVIAPRSYVQGQPGSAQLSTVLKDVARDAGETVSSTIAQSLLDTNLDRWIRPRQSAGLTLTQLTRELPAGTAWRVLDDGTVWLGADADEDVTRKMKPIFASRDRLSGTLTFIATQSPSSMRPGTIIKLIDETISVGRVVFSVTRNEERITVWER